jgi:hypothetical protein
MKMAKATQADLDAAMKLHQLLNAIDGGNFPPDGDNEEWPEFDEDKRDHLQSFLERALACFNNPPSGLMRVLMAASCALDPANKMYDPDKDYLDFHPRIALAEQQRDDLLLFAKEFRDAVLNQRFNLADNGMTSDQINDVLNLFDDTMGDAIAKAQGVES